MFAIAPSPMQARAVKPVRAVSCAAQKGEQLAAKNTAKVVAIASLVATPTAAQAAPSVDSAVEVTVQGVQGAGELLKRGFSAAVTAAEYAADAFETVRPGLSSAIEQATPIVKQSYQEVSKVAGPAISSAVPVITSTTKNLLDQSGLDVSGLQTTTDSTVRTATEAYTAATPTINKIISFLTTTEPETLAKGGVGLVGAYYLLPVALKALFGSLRGYSGELSAPKAVDLVSQSDNAILVDLRSSKEKGAVGVPDVPSNARGRFVELESAEIERRLRGQLRDANAVEAQITALEVAALKRVNRSSTLILLDRNGSQSKQVAKELSRLGFGAVYIVEGGFSGWSASKLQIRPPVPGAGGAQAFSPVANIIGTISTRVNNSVQNRRKTVKG